MIAVSFSALPLWVIVLTTIGLVVPCHGDENGVRLRKLFVRNVAENNQPRLPLNTTTQRRRDTEDDGSLRIHYFSSPSHARCADGSHSAIYSNRHSPFRDPTRHVFFVSRGNACFTDTECLQVMEDMPYKLSSISWPESVNGLSILSNNPVLNPLTHNYTFWLLPYCSQDAYLGSTTDPNNKSGGGLIKAGSLHMREALDYWLEQQQTQYDYGSSPLLPQEELIVVGSSAGALGVLNHMETILEKAQSANIQKLSVILDSSPLNVQDLLYDNDEVADNHNDAQMIGEYVESHVNETVHPMCFQTDEHGTPCCLSTHCMLRNDPIISSQQNGNRMLLINSMYDPFELSKIIEEPRDGATAGDYLRTIQAIDYAAGQRQQHIVETMNHLNNNGRGLSSTPANNSINATTTTTTTTQFAWASTSCVMHAFLPPSTFDIETVNCSTNSNTTTACRNGTTVGRRLVNIYRGQNLIIWNDPELWSTECINGTSIQSLIEGFLLERTVPAENSTSSQRLMVRFGDDDCQGANCASNNNHISPCQEFLELEESFVPVPWHLKWLVAGILTFGSFLGYIIRFNQPSLVRDDNSNHHNQPSLVRDDNSNHYNMDTSASRNNQPKSLAMRALDVYDPKGNKYLLRDVTFSIPTGAVTAICGKSGAGKTTLLRAMVGQNQPNLMVSVGESNFQLHSVCYVRQDDNCSAFHKMRAWEFLHNNAILYNATWSRLQQVSANIGSFRDTFTGDLSGGQRRRLTVCSALLLQPSLIVLDEPLTGLDSVSAQEFLDFIVSIAKADRCSVVMTIHSPTDDIARSFEKLIVVEDGQLVVNAPCSKLWPPDSTIKATPADDIHDLLESAGRRNDDSCKKKVLRQAVKLVDDDFIMSTIESSQETGCCSRGQRLTTAISALVARLRREFGLVLTDFVRLPATIFVLTWVLSWDDDSLNQVLFATIFCLAASYNVFQYKISQACKLWHMHRSEIIDGRISYLSYMLASKLYQFSPAILSLIPSLAIAYATLGWTFRATFVVQYIFSCQYLLVSLQAGRVLSIWFDGDHTKYMKPFSLFVVLNYMFSGTLVPISKFPSGLKWLYATSYTFWAASGAVLNQLQFGEPVGENPCTTAVTCIISNNSLIGRYLGYHPTTTPTLSLLVLTVLYMGLVAAEWLIGTRGFNRRFAKIKKKKQQGKTIQDEVLPIELPLTNMRKLAYSYEKDMSC